VEYYRGVVAHWPPEENMLQREFSLGQADVYVVLIAFGPVARTSCAVAVSAIETNNKPVIT
jgi:hypothetical protein